MGKDFYWNIFKSLERELVTLSEIVCIDNNQLSVYSIKIAELILRTVAEIESISKKLYCECENVTDPDVTRKLKFDYDCLSHISTMWRLEDKVVNVVCPSIFADSIFVLNPLKKSFGKGGYCWNDAYQGLKHNREAEFKKASIRNFIFALGALYMLNLYLRDDKITIGHNPFDKSLDASFGSEIFSVKVDRNVRFDLSYNPIHDEKSVDCVGIVNATRKSLAVVAAALKITNEQIRLQLARSLNRRIENNLPVNEEIVLKIFDELRLPVAKQSYGLIHDATQQLEYEVCINKFKY